MKNANSRFVRVLAVALVVLMVLPAALVGCGSNKANDAAISEALAAAQAAKDAADKAQQKAEAAQKELEEANKKAEQLEAELEALKTTKAPEATTAPVAGDKAQVQALAQETLVEMQKYLDKVPVEKYTLDACNAIRTIYERAVIAVYQAVTLDELVEIQENFEADVEAVPTYADLVYEAYKAIDFESDVDVFDVVYAYQFLTKAEAATSTKDTPVYVFANEKAKEAVLSYGEEKLNLVELIATEYYRYTGETANANTSLVKKVLYAGIYKYAQEIYTAIDKTIPTLKVADLKYDAISDKVYGIDAINEKFEIFFEDYFEDEDIEANYEAFRQAFVGEKRILKENKTEDAVWAAVLALDDRAAVLEAAKEAYDEGFSFDYLEIAGIKALEGKNLLNFNLNPDSEADDAAVLADAREAYAAWVAEYALVNDEGKDNVDVIKSIIGAADYDKFEANANIIDYLSAIKEAVAKIDISGLKAAADQIEESKEDSENDKFIGSFDYAKYATSYEAVDKWFNDTFMKITPASVEYKDFEANAAYTVAALVAEKAAVINHIFDNAFAIDYDDFDGLLKDVKTVYDALHAKKINEKYGADLINSEIKALLKEGISEKNIAKLFAIAGTSVSEYLNATDKEKKDLTARLDKKVKEFLGDQSVIVHLDVNYKSMIDWDGLKELWASVDAMLAEANDAAVEILNTYYAINGVVGDGKKMIELGKGVGKYLAKGTEKMELTVFSYELVKKLAEDAKKLDVAAKLFNDQDMKFNYTVYDENGKKLPDANLVAYNEAYAKAQNLISAFHVEMGKVEAAAEAIANALPIFDRTTSVNSAWGKGTVSGIGKTVADKYANNLAKGEDKDGKRKAYDWVANQVGWELEDKKLNKKSEFTFTVGKVVYGFNEAVIAVNPMDYITIKYPDADGDGKISAAEKDVVLDKGVHFIFDAKSYLTAVNAKLDEYYAKYQAEYLKAYSDKEDKDQVKKQFDTTIANIVSIAKANDLWNIAGEFGTYSYTYDFEDAKLKIKNAKGKPVTDYIKVSKIKLENSDVDVYVEFTVTVDKDVYTVKPVWHTTTDGKNFEDLADNSPVDVAIKNIYGGRNEYLEAELGFDADAHVYDVRKAAAEIGANFAKFNNVNEVASTKTYTVLTEAQLAAIFNAEATAIYNKDIAAEKAHIYKMSSGKVENGDIADGKLKEAALSGEALDHAKIYLKELTATYKAEIDATTTIKDAKAVVAEFEALVNAYFNGLKKSEE